MTGARARYAQVIEALADKYPAENLLLVTHGRLHVWFEHFPGLSFSVSYF